MCAIVGAFNFEESNRWTQIEINKLKFRGPDSQNILEVAQGLVMGVARLAMSDPHQRSNQPMRDPISGNAISFNGEIYNYLILKAELKDLGVKFETLSDTEVLLKYLTQYGVSGVKKLEGMFSFVFYDNKKETIYLCRDSLGKKPLYYEVEKNFIRWSSASNSFNNDRTILSTNALLNYLSLGYILDPHTGFKNINSVLPGECISYNIKSQKINKEIFKDNILFKIEIAEHNQETFKEIFSRSVLSRTENHNKVAISLSGGLDSSLIAIEMSKLEKEVCAFSAIWPDSDKDRYNNDAITAQATAKKLKIDFRHIAMPDSSQLPESLDLYLNAMGEPNSNPSAISMLHLYNEISKFGFRLVLTGDGADEIFAGYERYRKIRSYKTLLDISNTSRNIFFEQNQKTIQSMISKILRTQLNPNSEISWLSWHWIFTPPEIIKYFSPSTTLSDLTNHIYRDVSNLAKFKFGQDQVEAMMHKDKSIWLAMESNRKLDRMSMFSSIEARSPFQDENVIRFANKYMASTRFKELNKQIYSKEYPEILDLMLPKLKTGFISPIGHWLRKNPKLILDSLNYLCFDNKIATTEILFFKEAPNRGKFRELLQLWNLIVLARWLQTA